MYAVVTHIAQSDEVLRGVRTAVLMMFNMVQLKQKTGVTFPFPFVRPFALFALMMIPLQD
jgi:hypothetical protein